MDSYKASQCPKAGVVDYGEFSCAHICESFRFLSDHGQTMGEAPGYLTWVPDSPCRFGAPSATTFKKCPRALNTFSMKLKG